MNWINDGKAIKIDVGKEYDDPYYFRDEVER